MRIYAILGTIGLIANLGSAPAAVSTVDSETQKLIVPAYEITFDRGSYSVVEFSYDKNYSLSDSELDEILQMAGFRGKGLKMAKKIAFLESTNRPMAFNRSSSCYGLFQINMTGSMGPDRIKKYGLSSNEDLFNPLTNARIAYQMSNGGKNWGSWSTETMAMSK
jgi:hypothetical protein